jgi:hypothetical protein
MFCLMLRGATQLALMDIIIYLAPIKKNQDSKHLTE